MKDQNTVCTEGGSTTDKKTTLLIQFFPTSTIFQDSFQVSFRFHVIFFGGMVLNLENSTN